MGFNGAATLSLRKRTWAWRSRRSGRGFNGATTLSLRKLLYQVQRDSRDLCFNGAATLSLRKHTVRSISSVSRIIASMGPQLYRCGNVDMIGIFFQHQPCFNGAATLSLRKHVHVGKHPHFRRGLQWGRNFIVAETWRGLGSRSLRFMLQWGRNFIVAETREARLYARAEYLASMGPQLYRCGNASSIRLIPSPRTASMGPQLYRCGNSVIRPCSSRRGSTLQWGRNFIVAETICHAWR